MIFMANQTEKMCVISELETELQTFILNEDSTLSVQSEIACITLLNYRFRYIQHLIAQETTTSKKFDHELKQKIFDEEVHIKNSNDSLTAKETFGQKTADILTRFCGSWRFIIAFFLILIVWILLNTLPLFFAPFDKYPFILLNLALSCLAAIQAPIILMSQNRQADHDRIKADTDYEINVKSEVEILLLHEKMDYLMSTKWLNIIKLQELQIELLEELTTQNQKDRTCKRNE